MADSKEKLVLVSFKVQRELYEKLKEQVSLQVQQGDKELTALGYYLLGVLYAHDVFKTNPKLAADVLARIKFGRGGGNEKVDELLRMTLKLALSKDKDKKDG